MLFAFKINTFTNLSIFSTGWIKHSLARLSWLTIRSKIFVKRATTFLLVQYFPRHMSMWREHMTAHVDAGQSEWCMPVYRYIPCFNANAQFLALQRGNRRKVERRLDCLQKQCHTKTRVRLAACYIIRFNVFMWHERKKGEIDLYCFHFTVMLTTTACVGTRRHKRGMNYSDDKRRC